MQNKDNCRGAAASSEPRGRGSCVLQDLSNWMAAWQSAQIRVRGMASLEGGFGRLVPLSEEGACLRSCLSLSAQPIS